MASQTLENLGVIGYGQVLPILRPLIGMDKIEVMGLARRLGTYDISIREAEPCTYVPRHPLTRGSVAALERLLGRLELPVSRPAEVAP